MKCPIPLSEWPDWAEWAAMDENKSWYFFKERPKYQRNAQMWLQIIHGAPALYSGSDFEPKDTLTHRSELENQNQ